MSSDSWVGLSAEGETQGAKSGHLVTSEQTLAAARRAGLSDAQLSLSGVAVLTFNKAIMERLEELCGAKDAKWISGSQHPHGAAQIVRRGEYHGLDVIAAVPPMGVSLMACIIEDLVACGAKAIFLTCAAWWCNLPAAHRIGAGLGSRLDTWWVIPRILS